MEHYQAVGGNGIPLYMAVNAANELLDSQTGGNGTVQTVPSVPVAPAPSDNDRALAELQRMMQGVSGG